MKNLISIESCFTATGRDPKLRPIVDHLPEKDAKYVLADYILPVVVEAINKSVPPDWKDPGDRKHFIWWDIIEDNTKPSGFRLSFDDCFSFSRTSTYVSSRLTFRTLEGLKYAVANFLPEFENVYL